MTIDGPKRSQGRVLLVDDERNILRTFRYCLEDAGYNVATAQNAAEAETRLQMQVFDLCFLDLRLGEDSGMRLLPKLRSTAPWMRVIVVTAYSSIENAVEAMQQGAADYLPKPCAPEQLRLTAARHMEAQRLTQRLQRLEDELGDRAPAGELESGSPLMMSVLETAQQVANTDATVLIRGESGTGKGVLAKAIHRWSERAEQAFVTVNCPSLSPELVESELFGHRKGAFTGAVENTLGRVSQGDGGTLFFDEIGDFPVTLQPKLLRFVQDKEYERVGDATTRQADLRFIAATNRDLEAMVSDGRFREDLLYRLNVITLDIPPLRERPEDIAELANQFLTRYAQSYRRPARHFSDAAQERLRDYQWPGNVRELQNVVERAVILSSHETIDAQALAVGRLSQPEMTRPSRLRAGDAVSLEALERAHIAATVATTDTLEQAARQLDIDPSTLWRKRKQYGI